MTGEVSFIEFGGTDAMTARSFYGKLFGWSFESGPGGDGYAIEGAGVPAGVHGGDEGASPYVFFRVDDLDAAMDHIRTYSTHHTESIITQDDANSERFLAEVDSAVVMVNTSTRFTDGGEFGFGAEVGISTQKLHARGPMGLAELTSTKWLARGFGQVRS